MLRILLQPTDKYLRRFYGVLEVAPELRDLGIDIGLDVADPDIAFATIAVYEKRLSRGIAAPLPVILYERADSACIYPASRRPLIANPSVIGWAKGMGLRDIQEYNAPLVHEKRHLALLAPDRAVAPEVMIAEADLLKIAAIMPVFAWEVFRPLVEIEPPDIMDRFVDVSYSGAIWQHADLVGQHRVACTSTLARFDKLNVIIGLGRVFRLPDMYQMMRDSKIFVSPYGLGEYSSKDYEAILSGAVLVKPSSGHVVADGFDIFAEENAVPCAADLSDLGDVVETLLSDKARMTDRARATRARLVKTIADREARATRLASFFRACAARIPASLTMPAT